MDRAKAIAPAMVAAGNRITPHHVKRFDVVSSKPDTTRSLTPVRYFANAALAIADDLGRLAVQQAGALVFVPAATLVGFAAAGVALCEPLRTAIGYGWWTVLGAAATSAMMFVTAYVATGIPAQRS